MQHVYIRLEGTAKAKKAISKVNLTVLKSNHAHKSKQLAEAAVHVV